MTKNEAYNAMIEGKPVSHKDFAKDEFLFMDNQFIIRDENGDEFEASWDVKTGDNWETDWYIYKGKFSKDELLSKLQEREEVPEIIMSEEAVLEQTNEEFIEKVLLPDNGEEVITVDTKGHKHHFSTPAITEKDKKRKCWAACKKTGERKCRRCLRNKDFYHHCTGCILLVCMILIILLSIAKIYCEVVGIINFYTSYVTYAVAMLIIETIQWILLGFLRAVYKRRD